MAKFKNNSTTTLKRGFPLVATFAKRLVIGLSFVALPSAGLFAPASMAGDIATLLKELERELSALDEPVRTADPKVPTQSFKALAIPDSPNPHEAALTSKLASLKKRIASQRQHVLRQFGDSAAVTNSHVARIAADLAPAEQHPVTNLKVYLDDVLVFAAQPLAALTTQQTTIYENTLAPRQYRLKITGSRLVTTGDDMRLEEFAVKAPWPISADQKRHLALIKPIIAADGKASLEVLFD